MHRSVTLIREPLDCAWTAAQALRALAGEPLPFALSGAWAGGGAIVSSDPLAVVTDADGRGTVTDADGRVTGPAPAGAAQRATDRSPAGQAQAAADPFAVLDRLPVVDGAEHASAGVVGGGWFGWLGYRLAAAVESVPLATARPTPMPQLHFAYYDNVLRLDPTGHWWFEALAADDRRRELQQRLSRLRRLLAGPPASPQRARVRMYAVDTPEPFVIARDAADGHVAAVAECRDRIAAGEIFQANICLRLDSRFRGSAASLYASAQRTISPPYAAAFDTPHGSVASLSPELFLRRRGGDVVTGPIKGTIPRSGDPAADAAALQRLRGSVKDAAEHVMIVDLMRNDIGRVCSYGSVTAPRTPAAEPHPGLWHLVSQVRGRLRPQTTNAALLRATFPPGSVTGAPKVQSLRVIAELERSSREIYTGSVGYASPLAGLELNVAIRTLELKQGRLWIGAGGGIVADSDPRAELDEAIAKARPIAAAVGADVRVGSARTVLPPVATHQIAAA